MNKYLTHIFQFFQLSSFQKLINFFRNLLTDSWQCLCLFTALHSGGQVTQSICSFSICIGFVYILGYIFLVVRELFQLSKIDQRRDALDCRVKINNSEIYYMYIPIKNSHRSLLGLFKSSGAFLLPIVNFEINSGLLVSGFFLLLRVLLLPKCFYAVYFSTVLNYYVSTVGIVMINKNTIGWNETKVAVSYFNQWKPPWTPIPILMPETQ